MVVKYSSNLLKEGYQFVKSTGNAGGELSHYIKRLPSGATKKIYSNDVVTLTKDNGQIIMKKGDKILTHLRGIVHKWTKIGESFGWKPLL